MQLGRFTHAWIFDCKSWLPLPFQHWRPGLVPCAYLRLVLRPVRRGAGVVPRGGRRGADGGQGALHGQGVPGAWVSAHTWVRPHTRKKHTGHTGHTGHHTTLCDLSVSLCVPPVRVFLEQCYTQPMGQGVPLAIGIPLPLASGAEYEVIQVGVTPRVHRGGEGTAGSVGGGADDCHSLHRESITAKTVARTGVLETRPGEVRV